jgi:hypothetical protein
MGFKLSTASSYPWPVSGELAGTRYSFTAHFAFLRQDRIEELTQQLAKRQRLLEIGQDDPDLEHVNSRAVAAEVLVDWSGVTGDDGEPVDFAPSAMEKLLQIQGVAIAVCNAWAESLQGAKRGNSKAPRGIG